MFSVFSPLIMGTGKRWKWLLVTWPHSKIPSVRTVFGGRVRRFWQGECVDSGGSVCGFRWKKMGVLVKGCADSGGRECGFWRKSVGILKEDRADSVGRVCGFESWGVWILAERCVFLEEEYWGHWGFLWKGAGILMEGIVDSGGRLCDSVLH